MQLKDADNNDLSAVLKETCRIWSPGLPQSQYFDYLSAQLNSNWSRAKKSMRFLVLKDDPLSPPLGALKYYHLAYRVRGLGEPVNIAGLGAIYTLREMRGRGLGKTMVRLAVDRARAEGMEAVLLYSDIGSDFYRSFGFFDLDCRSFEFEMGRYATGETADKFQGYRVEPAFAADGERLRRYYRQWQSRQPLAIARSDCYWRFMLDRDAFIKKHNPGWAPVEAVLPEDPEARGYALFRMGTETLRVLEVCAIAEEVRQALWKALTGVARSRGRSRLEGWESALADIYPGRHLPREAGSMRINLRAKEKGMILALRDEVANWTSIKPAPFLEFDHF